MVQVTMGQHDAAKARLVFQDIIELRQNQVNAVKMLFWAAVVNGILAPPLVVLVTLLTSDKKVMGDRTSPPVLKILGWMTAILMTCASIAMAIL